MVRVEPLGDDARRLLVLAAADDSGDVGTLLRASERLGFGPDALDVAERAGLLTVDGRGCASAIRSCARRSTAPRASPSAVRRTRRSPPCSKTTPTRPARVAPRRRRHRPRRRRGRGAGPHCRPCRGPRRAHGRRPRPGARRRARFRSPAPRRAPGGGRRLLGDGRALQPCRVAARSCRARPARPDGARHRGEGARHGVDGGRATGGCLPVAGRRSAHAVAGRSPRRARAADACVHGGRDERRARRDPPHARRARHRAAERRGAVPEPAHERHQPADRGRRCRRRGVGRGGARARGQPGDPRAGAAGRWGRHLRRRLGPRAALLRPRDPHGPRSRRGRSARRDPGPARGHRPVGAPAGRRCRRRG